MYLVVSILWLGPLFPTKEDIQKTLHHLELFTAILVKCTGSYLWWFNTSCNWFDSKNASLASLQILNYSKTYSRLSVIHSTHQCNIKRSLSTLLIYSWCVGRKNIKINPPWVKWTLFYMIYTNHLAPKDFIICISQYWSRNCKMLPYNLSSPEDIQINVCNQNALWIFIHKGKCIYNHNFYIPSNY